MKNFLRYVIPAMLVLAGIIGIAAIAAVPGANPTVLQTWQTTSGTRVATVDTNGAFNCNNALSVSTSGNTPAITNSGSISFAVAAEGAYDKRYVIATGGTTFTASASQTFTFPTPFLGTPIAIGNTITSGSGSALTLTSTSAVLSASGTGSTGALIIEGN